MPPQDQVLPVAFALYYSPKRYAILVGSGISSDTGILTASEITDDLIRQIAGEKIKSGQSPLKWYEETHEGNKPTFTSLFDELANSREDREAILSQYFEPKDRDSELIKNEPTIAHLSIARLVRDGIINMIITTNFDSLLEKAIEKETGKKPVVITHESGEEIMEIIGDKCRIVKINGDYSRTSLKLTPNDLLKYDPKLAEYLNRIFSEYGLVVCGWSGDHDTGLVKILTEERFRRFGIFWCSCDSPEKIPPAIRLKLNLSTIGIRSANDFFNDLESQIEILRRHNRTSLLTFESAIKKVKEALNEKRPELKLSDLLHDETERVLAEINRLDIFPEGMIDGKTCFKNRLEELEFVTSPLAAMVATISFYDDGLYSDLITETIDRLINLRKVDLFLKNDQQIQCISISKFKEYFYRIRFYPALLVIYTSGLAAVQKRNFNNLYAILEKPGIRYYNDSTDSWKITPYFDNVNMWNVLWTSEQWTLDFSFERFGKKENFHYYPMKVIQKIVNNFIPNEFDFETAFDSFEYFYGLSYLNLTGKEPSKNYPLSSRLITKYHGAYFDEMIDGISVKIPDQMFFYLSEIDLKIEGSKFFNGDLSKFNDCKKKYTTFFNIYQLFNRSEYSPGDFI